MSKKSNSHQYIGHHMPEGPSGIEIRIWEGYRGYYASTIYNPRGRVPADIGPFGTSREALGAGLERHGLDLESCGVVIPMRRTFIEDAPSLDMAGGW